MSAGVRGADISGADRRPQPTFLNLGCGTTFHPDWINMDMMPAHPSVQKANLLAGIPLRDDHCDAVYHSHVLEHFGAEEGRHLIAECRRVLKPGAILRVVVPDLEQIARLYVKYFEAALSGQGSERYDWMMLELYDQTTRATSGGAMRNYLEKAGETERRFVRSRLGWEAERIIESLAQSGSRSTLLGRARRVTPAKLWRHLRIRLCEAGCLILGGKFFRDAFREGMFRSSGEVHRCMYDRFSLGRLLESSGFEQVRTCQWCESAIPGFTSYALDSVNDQVRKPDSLFMEARKPQN